MDESPRRVPALVMLLLLAAGIAAAWGVAQIAQPARGVVVMLCLVGLVFGRPAVKIMSLVVELRKARAMSSMHSDVRRVAVKRRPSRPTLVVTDATRMGPRQRRV